MYLPNKYTNWYNLIISRAISRTLPSSMYIEHHHILPKCLGGLNNKENIVQLTAREHFICHLLLPKMISDKLLKSKLAYALWQMTQTSHVKRYKVTSVMYELLKQQLSKNTKGIPKSKEHKAALKKPKSSTENMKGGTGRTIGFKVSNESKLKQSNSMKGKYTKENNPFFGKHHSEETKQKYRDLFTGVPLSEEHKKNISEGSKGKIPWNKGVSQPKLCCLQCHAEIDRANFNRHYDSVKCKKAAI